MKYVERDNCTTPVLEGAGRIANIAPPTSVAAGARGFGETRTRLLAFLRDNPGSCAGDAVSIGIIAQTSSARANELLGRNGIFNEKHPGGPWLYDTGYTKRSPYSSSQAAILDLTEAGRQHLIVRGL